MAEIAVSVLCTVYNHEKYLRKCLDGFVMQRTNFCFEVLVHDDASTDRSADIIREYEQKYPDIIKPVFQTENQYSQGISIGKTFLFPLIRGKYVATCEGDDYWCDENKLQIQYDFMESHPEYAACVHAAWLHSVDGSQADRVCPGLTEGREYSLEEIVAKGESLFETCSLFRRREVVLSQPSCFYAKGFGDYQAYLYAAICGKFFCHKEAMSVYNYGTQGSWTRRVWGDPKKRAAFFRERARMLTEVDHYYEEKYHAILQKKIDTTLIQAFITEKNFKMLLKNPYRELFIHLGVRKIIRLTKGKISAILKKGSLQSG